MKTIAQQINWDFGAYGSPLVIEDTNGNLIYSENSSGYWNKWKFNSNGKFIYFEDSSGYWQKAEYDSEGCLIYSEDSSGIIKDSRPKPSEDRVVEIDGVKYKLTKL